jgi:hypothetical protein
MKIKCETDLAKLRGWVSRLEHDDERLKYGTSP